MAQFRYSYGMSPKTPRQSRLGEIARIFLLMGATAFGGPAAHIALMNRELVEKRRWVSREEFLDLLAATNLIPGPNSTELAIHLGHRRAGLAGLLVAGLCFILPAAFLVTLIAWAYTRYGLLPLTQSMLYGVKPVIVAVVAHALISLGRTALKTPFLTLLAGAVVLANFFGVNELQLLALAAGLAILERRLLTGPSVAGALALPFSLRPAPLALAGAIAAGAAPFTLGKLFLFFAKVGSVLFGSGYVLIAFLRADLVDRWHWLTEAQLIDAIAVGQFTPGPVFTTATFIGYLLAGLPGAFLATAGIFLPAFFFVAISAPLIMRLRRSPTLGAALDGLNAASLALMAMATAGIGWNSLMDGPTALIAALSFWILRKGRLNSAWLVAGGAAAGWLLGRY